MATFIGSETGFTVLGGGEVLRVDAWGESGVRVRATLGAQSPRHPAAPWARRGAIDAQVEISDDRARMRNGDLIVEVYVNHEERFVPLPAAGALSPGGRQGAVQRERPSLHVSCAAAVPPRRRRPVRL